MSHLYWQRGEGEYRKLGSDEMLKTDARIIAATNKDLGKLVRQGRFREDLHNRLYVHTLRIPPFRERSEEDRHEVALQIISRLNPEFGTSVKRLGKEAYEQLIAYTWDSSVGNVRGLKNAIERSLAETKGDTLGRLEIDEPLLFESVVLIPADVMDFNMPWAENRRAVVKHCENVYCVKVYHRYNEKVKLAARHAGISPQQFNKKLKIHRIR